ncbi:YcaO-like family protein (plasmid) [Rhizobium sp. Pop5]|uniref:YcaO-like family protein n=1 Tax=Rhizobium sp. Pop5 TaxID=1223565 RepID=UPI0013E30608|nr:YcaO-like family protein [Rhizobium sp. Pop5]UVD59543.1 YcaO-like family protein [Rhizobium sp. Pop5]
MTPAYPASIFEPTVFSADDANDLNGHGFGLGPGVAVKAMGEYFERYAAFRAVTSRGMGKIAEMRLDPEEQDALVLALRQTCHDDVRDDIEAASFRLVEVNRLGEDRMALYPTLLLSLHSFDEQRDVRFAPVRDSSGSAIHPDKKTAFQGALLEFVERQCTTAMWVSRRCNAIEGLGAALKDRKARAIHDQMAMAGSLNVLDLSFLKGASVKFCEYKSQDPDALVNFSCGCSADFDPDAATAKAFTEAWQTSLLLPQMEFFGAREYGSTSLKDNFQAANRAGFELGVGVDPRAIGADGNDRNMETLVDSILSVSRNVYLYFRSIYVAGTKLHFCRVVSPDFFLHMSPGDHNNNDNRWIDLFCEKASRRLEPMPFS